MLITRHVLVSLSFSTIWVLMTLFYIFICVVLGVCAASNGNCSDICTDVNGTAVCSCKPGYLLGLDNKTCAGEGKCYAIIDVKSLDWKLCSCTHECNCLQAYWQIQN